MTYVSGGRKMISGNCMEIRNELLNRYLERSTAPDNTSVFETAPAALYPDGTHKEVNNEKMSLGC